MAIFVSCDKHGIWACLSSNVALVCNCILFFSTRLQFITTSQMFLILSLSSPRNDFHGKRHFQLNPTDFMTVYMGYVSRHTCTFIGSEIFNLCSHNVQCRKVVRILKSSGERYAPFFATHASNHANVIYKRHLFADHLQRYFNSGSNSGY